MRNKVTRFWSLAVALTCALAISGYRFSHYLTHESAYCVSCHAAAAQSVRQLGHQSIACQDCHDSVTLLGARLVVGSWLGSRNMPPHARRIPSSCRACHTGTGAKIPI